MQRSLFSLVAMLVAIYSSATAVRVPLTTALKSKDFIVDLHSRGGYCAKGLQLTVRNLSCRETIVEVPTGLIFKPANTDYQDLAITGTQDLDIMPDSAETAVLQTFCAKDYAGSPSPDISYSLLRVADTPLMRVLRYIKENGFNDHLGQHAVWAMTNNHTAGSVYDANRAQESKKFAAFVAKQKGEPAPRYYSIYNALGQQPGALAFDPTLQKLIVDLEWNQGNVRNMYYSVYRPDGSVYRKVAGTEHINGTNHRVHTVFDLKKVPPGTYIVRARDDMNNIWAEQSVLIE